MPSTTITTNGHRVSSVAWGWIKPWSAGFVLLSLLLAGVVAYRNSFSVPFLFDDIASIPENPTIRQLWPPWGALTPPSSGESVTSRPIVNLTLALNYAIGGLHVEGYHGFNLAIHLLVAFALYGIVRRTLLQPVMRGRYAAAAAPLAWLSALCWLVHPLLTEAVTCVVQRTESLMGLFYLGALYAAIRAMNAAKPLFWQVAAFVVCLTGMATKEVMVTAPLMIFLYDRTFVAGNFRAAWKLRRFFYLSLLATWVLLAWLVIGMGKGGRGESCGFNGTIAWWQYLFTQCYAIVRYLRLSVWPHPLVVDYGTYLEKSPAVIVSCGLLVVGLGAGTVLALWRRPVWGFLGVWFFAILAPSSSVLPVITQTMAERRMYLPLAVIVVLLVVGLHRWLKGWIMPVGLAMAGVLTLATAARNHDYRSQRSIWEDTVAKWPDEARPHLNLGTALMSDRATIDEAIRQFEQSLRLQPDYSLAFINLGTVLSKCPGREEEAVANFEKGLLLLPNYTKGYVNFGLLLSKLPGREKQAIATLQTALRLQPDSDKAHLAYGSLLVKLPGRRAEGIAELREAIRLNPEATEAHANLGVALVEDAATVAEAVVQLEAARKLKPDSAEVLNNLAAAYEKIPGQRAEAVSLYESAVKLDGMYWQAHYNLGMLLFSLPGRRIDAIGQLETATRLKPDYADAHTNLGFALAGMPGRLEEALPHFEAAVRIKPDAADMRFNLGTALAQMPGRQLAALEQFQAAVRLNPQDAEAHNSLGRILVNLGGRTAEAREQFEIALRLNPDLIDAHLNLAALLQTTAGGVTGAIQHLEIARKLSPDDTAVRELLARIKSEL